VPVPCPSCYTAALHLAAAVLCPVAAPCTDALAHSIAPHSLEAAWRRARESDILKPVHVRVLLLTNPHAPSGRLYTRAALHSALLWCRSKGIHLVVDETRAASVHRPGAVFCSAAAVAAAGYSSCGDSSSSSSSSSAAKRRRSSSSIPSGNAAAIAAAATVDVADTADTADTGKVEANSATASSSHNSDQQQQLQQQDLTEMTAVVSSSSSTTRALCGKAQDVHILYGCDGARQRWRGLNVAAIVSANSSAIAACRKAAAVSCPPSQLALLALHASLTTTTGTHTAAVAAVDKGALREKYLAVAQCLESCGLLYIQVSSNTHVCSHGIFTMQS
jgi:Aminotransferase class I and II